MLRRAQLAAVMIFLLLVAPLGAAACGARCLNVIAHPATVQHACLRADSCCHHSGQPAVCGASAQQEMPALLASPTADPQHDNAAAHIAAVTLTLPRETGSTLNRLAPSPPGPSRSLSAAPLRI